MRRRPVRMRKRIYTDRRSLRCVQLLAVSFFESRSIADLVTTELFRFKLDVRADFNFNAFAVVMLYIFMVVLTRIIS